MPFTDMGSPTETLFIVAGNFVKIIIFILLVISGVLYLPDGFIFTFVKRFIPVSGDGEYAMNNFEMIVLLIKALICTVGAAAVMTLFRTR